MNRDLPKTYDPGLSEGEIYKRWLENGYFNAEPDTGKTPYCIVIPPPNVTGQLHMGHAFDNTLQDILIRTKRMQGYEALWMPGTDHAGIATQIRVEASLREQGISRHDLGREEFVRRVWQWKEEYGGRIIEQLYRLGVSCDWRRTRFTMDEGLSDAVLEVFIDLYNKGLIYRGYRIINWCPNCATALSDTEVEYDEKPSSLWHIKYPVEGGGFIEVATTRPETMLGDSGIAVNPSDERYMHLIGKHAILPLMNRKIPIFADELVEKDFGTGCVKITPCHDPNDFEMGKRHELEFILIMDGKGNINENGGKYAGLSGADARKAVLKDLELGGLLVKTEPYTHNVGGCHRCGSIVEPLASMQWFVKMRPLAEKALNAVESGDIRFIPERFVKIFNNWMENVHDWCISRQLWWGHRIPAYYCGDCGEITVSKTNVSQCPKCNSTNVRADEDVLDTWFSSALWPFSTLGWPEKTPELEYFYPTNVLVTGYDIIFFWVARMVISGLEQMEKKPFSDVFIHGLIRDANGKKMSKSLNNGIDPLEIVDQYGADALRFTLVTGIGPGNDTRFSAARVESSRNFCNKIWNASRFVMMNLTVEDFTLPQELALEDKWILHKLNALTREVTDNIERYELGIAAEKLYSFIWDDYCDWYIELCKTRLTGGDQQAAERAQRVLGFVLTRALKLLHPFMPFITEGIFCALPTGEQSIMISDWPRFDEALEFGRDAEQMEQIMEVIRAVRTLRAEMNSPPSRRTAMFIATQKPELFAGAQPFLMKLAYAQSVEIREPDSLDGMASCVTAQAKIFIPLGELVDMEKELARRNAERENTLAQIERIESKLANEEFIAKAPEKVVNAERGKLANLKEKLRNLE